MAIEPGTISGIVNDAATLQRIKPTSNSGQREQKTPKGKVPTKELETVPDPVYTPDGHLEGEGHGLRLDLSA
jgi:hypothetical protein